MSQPVRQSAPYPYSADTLYDDGIDDVHHARIPSSARRYQGYGDVDTETGYSRADVRTLSAQGYRSDRFDRNDRSDRSNRGNVPGTVGRSVVPARRTATNIPAVHVTGQPRRRPVQVQTDDIDVNDVEDAEVVDAADAMDEMPTRRLPRPRSRSRQRRTHWLVFVGGAMFVMVIGWVLLSSFASWWQTTLDDWHYGRPRTYQVDAVVGHNDSLANPSHFIALNLNSRIEVIEFPGGDATKARVYVGPTLIGQGQDLAPVTLEFKDVNNDGKPDMIVSVGGSHFIYINDNGSFRPARTTDNIQV